MPSGNWAVGCDRWAYAGHEHQIAFFARNRNRRAARDHPEAALIETRSELRVVIVQQGVWEMPKESMPLAAGYLKASAADPDLRGHVQVEIQNFGGGDTD